MKPKQIRKNSVATLKFFLAVLFIFSLLVFESSKVGAKDNQKFNMSYVYFGDTASYIKQVKNTNGALNTVAPSYFDLHTDGSLHNKVDPVFVAEMHKIGVRVVPFISNHWDQKLGRKALANRVNLAREIAQAVEKYNLDGVNVDIENVTEIDKDNFTDFVRILREYLPEEKEVSVAVAANPNNWKKGWHGSYDYKELAKYSDYLMLMSYDESYRTSQPGPVASLSFVERSVQQLLKQEVPADKIVLGIPFFARYWDTNLHHSLGGLGIGSNMVDVLVERYNGKVYFDDNENVQSPYATFTIRRGDPITRLNYRDLLPGNYVVWFEDLKSIEKKLELVHKYNLKGTGSWSLNQAPVHIWDYYNAWLQGSGYVDILNHWGKDDIESMIEKKWMIGMDQHRFSPNDNITRAQVAAIFVRALGLDLDNKEINSNLVSLSSFEDVQGYWAEKEIELAYQYGLVKGRSKTEFDPRAYITREELAELITRILPAIERLEDHTKEETTIENKSIISMSTLTLPKFQDLDVGHWAYPSISILAERNILQGSQGNFRPKDGTTRAEFATVMSRMLQDDSINTIFVQ